MKAVVIAWRESIKISAGRLYVIFVVKEKGMGMEGMGMMDDGTMKSKGDDHSEHH